MAFALTACPSIKKPIFLISPRAFNLVEHDAGEEQIIPTWIPSVRGVSRRFQGFGLIRLLVAQGYPVPIQSAETFLVVFDEYIFSLVSKLITIAAV